jgi:hypothetical protein
LFVGLCRGTLGESVRQTSPDSSIHYTWVQESIAHVYKRVRGAVRRVSVECGGGHIKAQSGQPGGIILSPENTYVLTAKWSVVRPHFNRLQVLL